MTTQDDFIKVQNYFNKKYNQWQKVDPQGIEHYIRINKDNLAKEFNNDKGNINNDFNDVCRFLKKFEESKQQDVIQDVISIIKGITSFSDDDTNLLIAAVLKACYPNSQEIDNLVKTLLTITVVSITGILLLRLLIGKNNFSWSRSRRDHVIIPIHSIYHFLRLRIVMFSLLTSRLTPLSDPTRYSYLDTDAGER